MNRKTDHGSIRWLSMFLQVAISMLSTFSAARYAGANTEDALIVVAISGLTVMKSFMSDPKEWEKEKTEETTEREDEGEEGEPTQKLYRHPETGRITDTKEDGSVTINIPVKHWHPAVEERDRGRFK